MDGAFLEDVAGFGFEFSGDDVGFGFAADGFAFFVGGFAFGVDVADVDGFNFTFGDDEGDGAVFANLGGSGDLGEDVAVFLIPVVEV